MPSVLLLNDLNGIKKHVEGISVDAVLGCELCCVVIIYNSNYGINNYTVCSTRYRTWHFFNKNK